MRSQLILCQLSPCMCSRVLLGCPCCMQISREWHLQVHLSSESCMMLQLLPGQRTLAESGKPAWQLETCPPLNVPG